MKRLVALSILLLLFPALLYEQAIVIKHKAASGPTPTIWLPLNEGGSATTALDYSGHTYNSSWAGSQSCSSSYYTTGYVLSHAGCMGVSSNYAYFTTPTLTALGTTNTVSFTGWVYPTSVESGAAFFLTRSAGYCVGTILYNFYSTPSLAACWNNTLAEYAWNSGLVLSLNAWQFVAMTISATNQVIYLSGTSCSMSNATLTETNAAQNLAPVVWYGGLDPSAASTRHLVGYMEDVRIYPVTLNSTQVQNICNAGPQQ